MALVEEIQNYLVAQGVAPAGSTADYSVFMGYVPNQPDRIIAIYETGGFPNMGFSTGTVDQPTFQVRVRSAPWSIASAGYSSARAKLETIRTKLESVLNLNIGSPARRYLHIKAMQSGALDLGRDENDRATLVLNFHALRSRTS